MAHLETSAPIRALEVTLEIMSDRPTHHPPPTNWTTDGLIEKFHFQQVCDRWSEGSEEYVDGYGKL